jgi:thiol-disulfide isomerase/thioredoxin
MCAVEGTASPSLFNRLCRVLASGVSAAALLSACGPTNASQTTASTVAGRTLSGSTASLSSLRGHVVVVVFWASWCEPCRAEQPQLNAAYAKWSAHAVAFLGVDMRDDANPAIAFQHEMKVRYPSLVDADAAIAAYYKIPAAPALVFIDPMGKVAERILGGLGTMNAGDFDAEIRSLM